jgi:hypothetical protein
MSFLSQTWKSHQAGFGSARVESISVRTWGFAPPILKEFWKVALVLMICLVIMTSFVALGAWTWVPYSHH